MRQPRKREIEKPENTRKRKTRVIEETRTWGKHEIQSTMKKDNGENWKERKKTTSRKVERETKRKEDEAI